MTEEVGVKIASGVVKGVLSRWDSISQWFLRLLWYRVGVIPRCTVTLTEDQLYRPMWTVDEGRIYARCNWNVTNVTDKPVTILNAYLGDEVLGVVTLIERRTNILSPAMIQPGETRSAKIEFQLDLERWDRGTEHVETVTLVDQYENRYKRKVRFPYYTEQDFADYQAWLKRQY